MAAIVEPATSARPAAQLPGYDGPRDPAARHTEARLLATARTTTNPLYRASPGDCLILLYRAMALNVSVGVAVDNIYIDPTTGRSGLTAQLMAGLLQRDGVRIDTLHCNDQRAVIRFRRGRKTVGDSEWRISEAVTAQLTRRDVWRQYPSDCLWARALARGLRRLFPGLSMGYGYTPEEVKDMAAGITATDTPAADSDPRITALLEEATSHGVTAERLRALLDRARRQKLAKTVLADATTVEDTLTNLWRTVTVLETAAAADAAHTAAAAAAAGPGEVMNAPAGVGQLPCGCPAAVLLAGQPHREDCTHVPTAA